MVAGAATVYLVHTGNLMKPFVLVFLSFFAVACLFAATAAEAEDEDMTSSLYLVFDPETGEFVEEADPDRVKQDHAAREVDSGGTGAKDATTTTNADENSGATFVWIASAAAALLLLVGGAIWSQRRKEQAA